MLACNPIRDLREIAFLELRNTFSFLDEGSAFHAGQAHLRSRADAVGIPCGATAVGALTHPKGILVHKASSSSAATFLRAK
jgi:hypothetical protein